MVIYVGFFQRLTFYVRNLIFEIKNGILSLFNVIRNVVEIQDKYRKFGKVFVIQRMFFRLVFNRGLLKNFIGFLKEIRDLFLVLEKFFRGVMLYRIFILYVGYLVCIFIVLVKYCDLNFIQLLIIVIVFAYLSRFNRTVSLCFNFNFIWFTFLV